MSPASLGRYALDVLALLTVAGCGVRDIVVAQDQGHDGGVGTPCAGSMDCAPLTYCAKAACDDAQGQCQLRPMVCDDTSEAVCGCDGVNYWNDCLRRRGGVAASSPGECTSQFATCGGRPGSACPAVGAFCAKLFSSGTGPCTSALAGVCWVLPPACPPDDAGAVWASCGPAPTTCLDGCSAIRTQKPFQLAAQLSCP